MMNRIVLKSKVGSDGVIHLNVSVGQTEANKDVQVTVEPVPQLPAEKAPTMTASDLLNSGLVGIWAHRTDIVDSRAFACRLREQAQTRRHEE
jgi:hypothetical protein